MDPKLYLVTIVALAISCLGVFTNADSIPEDANELEKRQSDCGDGFYETSSRYETNCQPCPQNCNRCRNSSQCTECVDGKFGDTCDRNCSFGCKKCVAAYSGAVYSIGCIECLPNLYGSMCMFNCSFCQGGLCTRDNCINGCIQGWYEYQTRMCVKCPSTCETCDPWSWNEQRCTSCPPAKWGNLCDKTCPSTCPSNSCDRETGQCACADGTFLDTENNICSACPENCIKCTSLTACSNCAEGKYGSACEHSCVPNCLECKAERTYNPYHEVWEWCSKCKKGYHKNDYCYPCEEGCSDCWWMPRSRVEECNRCKDGYYKDRMAPNRIIMKCFRCPPGCKKCRSNGECQSCFEGYFWSEYTCCPTNCESCSSPTSCTSCKSGFHGNTCQLSK